MLDRALLLALAFVMLGALIGLAPPVDAGTQDNAKVALHVTPRAAKTAWACLSDQAGGAAPSELPCDEYTTEGDLGTWYDVYLVVGNGANGEFPPGIGGVSCGISYNAGLGEGVDVISWTPCADGLEFKDAGPNGPWPQSGSGIRITWASCSSHPDLGATGQHAIVGAFTVFAYGTDRFEVTENLASPSGPELLVADCVGAESTLPSSSVGVVQFSVGAGEGGFTPCTTVASPVCAVSTDDLRFGRVSLAGYKDLSFQIMNEGIPEAINLVGSVSLDCPDFQVISGGEYDVAPGEASTVTIRFTPAGYEKVWCYPDLGTAECSHLAFALSGTGRDLPIMEVVSGPMDVHLESGEMFTQTISVSNSGNSNLIPEHSVRLNKLETVLANLNAGADQIVAAIPDVYLFEGGESGREIRNTAVYFYGNNIGTFYTDGEILAHPSWVGGRYFTQKFPGLFVYVVDIPQSGRFRVGGRLRSEPASRNGYGEWIERNNVDYRGLGLRWFGGTIPSVNHLVIVTDPNVSQYYDTFSRRSEDHYFQGLNRTARLCYLLYMGEDGAFIDNAATRTIAETFLDVVYPGPGWISIEQDDVLVPPGASTSLQVTFDATEVHAGNYFGDVVVRGNDPNLPMVLIPVQLHVTGFPDINALPASLDFNEVVIGWSETDTVTISNSGNDSLVVTGVTSDDPDYAVVPGVFSLAPDESRDLEITFSPSRTGSIPGTLEVQSNDPDQPTLAIALSGLGLPPPEIAISTDAIHGVAMPGGVKSRTVSLCNEGASDLIFEISCEADWIDYAPISGRVPVGECMNVEIQLNADDLELGQYAAEILISSNDPSNPAEVIEALLDVDTIDAADVLVEPESLNPHSNGRWISIYVELPTGYDPAQVLLETVVAAGAVPADPSVDEIEDFNENEVPDRKFKFDREAFILALPPADSADVTITGEVDDVTIFMATDRIRLVRPHLVHPVGGEELTAGVVQEVQWENPAPNAYDRIVVSYSDDGGGTWTPVGTQESGNSYLWRVPEVETEHGQIAVKAYNDDVLVGYDTTSEFTVVRNVVGIGDSTPEITLPLSNHPNPFRGLTAIRFHLPEGTPVTLQIFSVDGRKVRELVNAWLPAGAHGIEWRGKDDSGRVVSAGMYLYRLRTTQVDLVQRMLFLR